MPGARSFRFHALDGWINADLNHRSCSGNRGSRAAPAFSSPAVQKSMAH